MNVDLSLGRRVLESEDIQGAIYVGTSLSSSGELVCILNSYSERAWGCYDPDDPETEPPAAVDFARARFAASAVDTKLIEIFVRSTNDIDYLLHYAFQSYEKYIGPIHTLSVCIQTTQPVNFVQNCTNAVRGFGLGRTYIECTYLTYVADLNDSDTVVLNPAEYELYDQRASPWTGTLHFEKREAP